MAYQIKNRCTTAVTVNLDGENVTIPAGDVSPIFSKMVNTAAMLSLGRSGSLVLIDVTPPSPSPVAKRGKVASKASDQTVDVKAKKSKKLTAENPPWLNADGSAKTEENDNSTTDKESGG